MEIIQAIILGLVQGLTEFLPISSSGHLLLLEKIGLGSPSVFFNLALHAGTLFSAIVFYRKKIYEIIKKPLGKESLYLIAATAATGALALVAERFFGEILEGKYLAIGFMLTAVLLFSVEAFGGKTNEKTEIKSCEADNKVLSTAENARLRAEIGSCKADNKAVINGEKMSGEVGIQCERMSKKAGKNTDFKGKKGEKSEDISLKSAVICGLCQGIAVVPGLSRSGATISSLLFMGADREKAANFSFMLSMPVIAAGFILEIVRNQAFSLPKSQIFPLLAGMAAAAIGGFFAIKGFVRFLKKRSMKGFAYYAAALAVLCGLIFGVV
jgi:undecaprenyl-diphosphatase